MSVTTSTFPVNITNSGYVAQTPASLQELLISTVTNIVPGYTANLPGSLIEDISSTDVYALLIMDSALQTLINSITPYACNPFILTQLGNVYGTQQGLTTYTSAYVIFTGTQGFPIPVGFTVSDGTYQYTVQDSVTIPTGTGGVGSTAPTYVLATTSGTWAVPANTITNIITSVGSSITLSVNNIAPGTPGTGTAETTQAYQARVQQAGLVAAQGMPAYLKTLLNEISGVQTRLIAVQQGSPGWKVIVGGGDPYSVAGAIYNSLFDVSTLTGSTVNSARNITVSINDYPDTYTIVFINPVEINVTIQLTWGTNSLNYINPAAISALGNSALVSYINSINVGQPINLFELQNAFQIAVSSVLPTQYLTKMLFTVTQVGGSVIAPETNTGIITTGDPEAYWFTTTGQITITQG